MIPLAALSTWIVLTGQLKPAATVEAANSLTRTAEAS